MRPSFTARLAIHACNSLVIVFFLLPIAAALIGSLQSDKSLEVNTHAVFPQNWTLDNYRVFLHASVEGNRTFAGQAAYLPEAIKMTHYALANSAIIAISVTVLTLVCGSLSALAIARLRMPWLIWLMNLNVFARFIPVIVLVIPLYVTFRHLGLLNSLSGVTIAETGLLLPFSILILVPYFESVPTEIENAARIDGCSRFGAFMRVTLPLSMPILISYGAIIFIAAWNELLIPLVLNNSNGSITLPVLMANLVGNVNVFYGLMMAICILAMAPSVILAIALQKFVVRGLTLGALAG